MNLNHSLIWIIMLSVSFSSPEIPFTFETHEIELGYEKYQTILSGDLSGNEHSEISVTSRDSLGNVTISIFSFEDEDWKKTAHTELSKLTAFVDIANIAGRERFIYFESGRFYAFNPVSLKSEILFSFSFQYTGRMNSRIPWVNMTKDLNGDYLDEFIIPEFDGFLIFIQKHDGSFSDPVKLGPTEPYLDFAAVDDTRTYGEVGLNAMTIPWYLSRVHFYDHNLDGRKDLVFWNKDHFDVYKQTETGLFKPDPDSFYTDVNVGTDAPYSLAFQFSGKGNLSLIFGLRKSSTHTYLRGIGDINGDGISDIVTHTLSGRSPLKMKSQYNIYYGNQSSAGAHFANDNSSLVYPSGKAGIGETAGYSHYWFDDFNNDHKKDLFRYDVRIGFGSIIRTLLFKTVYIEYEFFQNGDNGFSIKPEISGLWKVTFDWDAGFYPAIKIGDVNGDQKKEIIATMNPDSFHIYSWDDTENNLSNQPQTISAAIPGNELNTWLFDINGDKKDDIFFYHPFGTSPNRLIVLTAK